MNRILIGIAGIVVILAVAFALSNNRRAVRPRVVAAAFALQALIAVLVLYVPAGKVAIEAMARGVSALLGYAAEGTKVIFGPLATDPTFGLAFAISSLPVIIFFASLVAVLYHLGIMQLVIKWVGGAIKKITGITKVESLGAAVLYERLRALDPATAARVDARNGRRVVRALEVLAQERCVRALTAQQPRAQPVGEDDDRRARLRQLAPGPRERDGVEAACHGRQHTGEPVGVIAGSLHRGRQRAVEPTTADRACANVIACCR